MEHQGNLEQQEFSLGLRSQRARIHDGVESMMVAGAGGSQVDCSCELRPYASRGKQGDHWMGTWFWKFQSFPQCHTSPSNNIPSPTHPARDKVFRCLRFTQDISLKPSHVFSYHTVYGKHCMRHYCKLPDFRVLPWALIITFCFSTPLCCLSQICVHRHRYTHRWMDVKFSRVSHVVVTYLITKWWQFPSGNWNRLHRLGVLFKICHIPWVKPFCDGKDGFVLP